jgi:hypothetical protein
MTFNSYPKTARFEVGEMLDWDFTFLGNSPLWEFNITQYGEGPFRVVGTEEVPEDRVKETGHTQKVILETPDGVRHRLNGAWFRHHVENSPSDQPVHCKVIPIDAARTAKHRSGHKH